MTDLSRDPVALTAALVRCESVTPAEAGALTLLAGLLAPAGFDCRRLVMTEPGFPDVDNLYARIGSGHPHLCFAGHTDVVPAGDIAAWTHGPFSGDIAEGFVWGRGTVDMKGNIAAFLVAALDWLRRPGNAARGSISFLITGDEEADAVNGTIKVLDWMARNGETPDHCIVGEPSCSEKLGDTLRIGRRGSLGARLVVNGRQGHVGYAHLANNPVRGFVKVASALWEQPIDEGTPHFVPSNLEIVSVDVDNPVYNVVPAHIEAKMNVRYNSLHTGADIRRWLERTAESALAGTGLTHEWAFTPGNAESFVTEPGPLVDMIAAVMEAETGSKPVLSTAGGTSDARFVKDYCQVVELGLVNKGIHAVDEKVPVEDLKRLTAIYGRVIESYFSTFAP